MTLRFSTTVEADVVTLVVAGQIDASSASELRHAIDGAFGRGPRLDIDLTAVDLLLSAGVNVLYDYVDRQPRLVIEADSVVARVLNLVGLDEALTVRVR